MTRGFRWYRRYKEQCRKTSDVNTIAFECMMQGDELNGQRYADRFASMLLECEQLRRQVPWLLRDRKVSVETRFDGVLYHP